MTQFELTITRTATTVTLSDGQTAWTYDRTNLLRLIAHLQHHAAQLEDEVVERPRVCPRAVPTGKVVAP